MTCEILPVPACNVTMMDTWPMRLCKLTYLLVVALDGGWRCAGISTAMFFIAKLHDDPAKITLQIKGLRIV
jgi:hypothetical protein